MDSLAEPLCKVLCLPDTQQTKYFAKGFQKLLQRQPDFGFVAGELHHVFQAVATRCDDDCIGAQMATTGDFALRVGGEIEASPPLVRHQVAPDFSVGFFAPIGAEHRGIGLPVILLPETPHDESAHSRMAVTGDQKIAGVIGLKFFVLGVDVELGDVDRQARCLQQIEVG